MNKTGFHNSCTAFIVITILMVMFLVPMKAPADDLLSFFTKKKAPTVICEKQECKLVSQIPATTLITKLNKFFAKNKNIRAHTYIEEGQTFLEKTINVVLTYGTRPQAGVWLKFTRISEIFFVDREKAEININLGQAGERYSYQGGARGRIPETFPAGGGSFLMKEGGITYQAFYRFDMNPTKIQWILDYVDLDNGIIGGMMDIDVSGLGGEGSSSKYVYLIFGSGKGEYLQTADGLKKTVLAGKPTVVATAKKPVEEKEEPFVVKEKIDVSVRDMYLQSKEAEKEHVLKPPKEEVQVISEEPSMLAFTTKLKLPGGAKILEGGKEATFIVDIENKGKGPARDVTVVLSGTKQLTDIFGESRFIDKINAGEKRTIEFKALLPSDVPATMAEIKVSLKEGQTLSAAGTKTMKVAMRPAVVVAREETQVISEEPAQLAFSTKLQLPGGAKILEGGKEATIIVSIENKGKGTARDVQAVLSGTPKVLIEQLGEVQSIGDVKAKEKKTVEFKALLPSDVPATMAEIKVSLKEGQTLSAAGTKTMKVAMRPAVVVAREETQVIEAPPMLVFSSKMTDQNKNRILDGGEQVTLTVIVQNTGGTEATGVEVHLEGNPILVKLLGQKKTIGNIKPYELRSAEFSTRLPNEIPTQTAELKICLKEAKGFSPTTRKTLKLAMRTGETDTEEIISEISVDDIPPKIKKHVRSSDYAVVIGISSYRDKNIAQVKYADRDAQTLARYIENLAGIPKPNINILLNDQATKADISDVLEEWLPKRVKPESNVFVFFAGHGTPDMKGEEAFIVPYEGHPDSHGKLIPLKKFYASLNKLGAKNVLVMLDSCFSGAKGRSIVPEGGRAVVIRLKEQVMSSQGVTVMAAAAGTQISSDYDKEKHGLFTYYLLKGMRGEAKANEQGFVEVGELFTFVKKNVAEKASLELNREQTPVLLPTEDAQSTFWRIPVVMTRQ